MRILNNIFTSEKTYIFFCCEINMEKTQEAIKTRKNSEGKLVKITCPSLSCGFGQKVPQENAAQSPYTRLVHRKTPCGYACDD